MRSAPIPEMLIDPAGSGRDAIGLGPVSYTHLTLPTSDLV